MADATFEVETNPHAAMIKRTMGLRGIVFLLMMVLSDHTRHPERPDRP